jgi:hypothetical protein
MKEKHAIEAKQTSFWQRENQQESVVIFRDGLGKQPSIYIYCVCVMHLLICIVYSFCKTKQKLNNDSMQKMKAYQYIL